MRIRCKDHVGSTFAPHYPQTKFYENLSLRSIRDTFVNCGHLKKFLLLPDLKIW